MEDAGTDKTLTGILARAEPSSAQVVDRALAALLAKPEMAPGTKLPTERLLAEELDVPRSAVRNGLARLETQGRVVRIMGSGTYVADQGAGAEAPFERQDASPREIMQARILIEPTLADLIVANANSSDIEKIRQAMVTAESKTDFEEFEIWDAKFHQALADASQNRLMIEVLRTINASRNLTEWGELKRRSVNEDRRRAQNQEHERIFMALRDRNAVAAREAIKAHLISVRDNLLGS